jgi:hypothetical protein
MKACKFLSIWRELTIEWSCVCVLPRNNCKLACVDHITKRFRFISTCIAHVRFEVPIAVIMMTALFWMCCDTLWCTYVLDESAVSIIFPSIGGNSFLYIFWDFFWTKHCHISEKSNLHVVFHCLIIGIPFIMYLSIAAVKDVLPYRKPSFTKNLQSIYFPAIHLTLFHSNRKVLTSPFKQGMHILKYFCDT